MPDRIVECNPQIQKSQSRHKAPYRAVGRIDRERGELQEKRVLVPEHPGPRRITNRQPDVHPQQHPQKQLGPLQPPRNPLRPVLSRRCPRRSPSPGRKFRPSPIPGTGREPRPRLLSRARGQRRRYHFRLLGHSLVSLGRAPIPAASQPFCTGPQFPARLRDAVLQRYHSKPPRAAAPAVATARPIGSRRKPWPQSSWNDSHGFPWRNGALAK